MRYLIMSAAACALLISFSNCKSKKSASTSTTTIFSPAPQQMVVAEKCWPGTNVLEVQEGQTIFVTKCTRCHQPVEITSLTEKKWLHEIDDMSPKAKLSPEEKLKLSKYILSLAIAKRTPRVPAVPKDNKQKTPADLPELFLSQQDMHYLISETVPVRSYSCPSDPRALIT
jgi:hypothetical protein